MTGVPESLPNTAHGLHEGQGRRVVGEGSFARKRRSLTHVGDVLE